MDAKIAERIEEHGRHCFWHNSLVHLVVKKIHFEANVAHGAMLSERLLQKNNEVTSSDARPYVFRVSAPRQILLGRGGTGSGSH